MGNGWTEGWLEGRGGGSDFRRIDTAHLLDDEIEQFSPSHVLQHHEVISRLVRKVLMNLDHVRVVEYLEGIYLCVCVCVFIKLHITAQSGLVILVILCHSH